MTAVSAPVAWETVARLLARTGGAAWLVDGAGVVLWASDAAGRTLLALAVPGTAIPGFVPGQPLDLPEGRLSGEAIDGGWALVLEPSATAFVPDAAALIAPLPDAMFWKDAAGVYRGCNAAFAAMLGQPAERIIGVDAFSLYPPDLAGKYKSMDDALMAAGPGAIQRYEWDLGVTGGRVRRVQFLKTTLCDAAGRVRGLVAVVKDVSERNRLERQFTTVFRACPDIITITEKATGCYIDVNDAFVARLGFAKEQVIGRTSMELGVWVTAEERQAMLAALVAQGRLSNFETRFRCRNGTVFTALMSVDSTELDGVPCLILVVHDITERKNAELVLRRTAEELHRSNAELERFAYVAAHDLQEPCRTICSFAQLLDRRYGHTLDQDGRDYLNYLSGGAQRMRQLVQGLLSYSRLNSNSLHFDTVDLQEIVASALADLSGATAQAGAEVCVGTLPELRGDALQLRQVMTNLIGNALKFQPEGHIPKIEVMARRDGEHWLIRVRDNGIGIDPQYAEEVFGMFRRLHGGDAYPGTGIGLAVVKRIVEAHGGRVWVESAAGRGSTFCLTLPA